MLQFKPMKNSKEKKNIYILDLYFKIVLTLVKSAYYGNIRIQIYLENVEKRKRCPIRTPISEQRAQLQCNHDGAYQSI